MKQPMKPDARAFVDALEDNESRMGDGAAMAVTCEQFGIDEDEGYDLLMSLAVDEDLTP